MGRIYAICKSEKKGTTKTKVDSIKIIENFGLEGDAHAGDWHRQVSLLSRDSVEDFQKRGNMEIPEGAFGENILVTGIDLEKLPLGTIIASGDVRLQITQIGKKCHHGCQIRDAIGDCIMPREGIFAKVLQGGTLRESYDIYIESYPPYKLAILTVSDKGSKGKREDLSGDEIEKFFKEKGFEIAARDIVPDEREQISNKLAHYSDILKVDLVLTTGGTGFSMRDITPEATLDIIDRNVPGIPEAMRAYSAKVTNKAMLSRAVSGIRKRTLIINLPGSKKAVIENIEAFEGALNHGLDILTGRDSECGGK